MNILLITAGSFAPWNTIGAIRWTKICKYLVQNDDVNIYVIAHKKRLQLSDELLVKDSAVCDTIVYMPEGFIEKTLRCIFYTIGKIKRQDTNVIVKKFDTLMSSQKYCRIISYRSFSAKAKKHIKKLHDKFDIVISTNPISAHWAALFASKRLNIPWMADFRDPIAPINPRDGYEKWLLGWQRKICTEANTIIAVSIGLKNVLCIDEEQLVKKAYVVYNGYDPSDKPKHYLSERKKTCFVYTGILYNGKRDLSSIFEAISVLLQEDNLSLDEIQFDYAGNDYKVLKAQASQYGLESIIINHGFISRKESIELQNKSDVLVIATYNDIGNPGVMPGKLYEYMMIQKPILAIVNGNVKGSELKDVMQECSVGYCHEASFDSVDDLKEYILSIIQNKNKGKDMNLEYRTERFEYPNIAHQIYDVIHETIGNDKNEV